MKSPAGAQFFGALMAKMMSGNSKPGGMDIDREKSDGLQKMMMGFTVKRMLAMAGTMGGGDVTKDQVIELNKALNKIPRV